MDCCCWSLSHCAHLSFFSSFFFWSAFATRWISVVLASMKIRACHQAGNKFPKKMGILFVKHLKSREIHYAIFIWWVGYFYQWQHRHQPPVIVTTTSTTLFHIVVEELCFFCLCLGALRPFRSIYHHLHRYNQIGSFTLVGFAFIPQCFRYVLFLIVFLVAFRFFAELS